MFDHYLRNQINPLQEDLRRTMKTYNEDKQRLMSELSMLRGSERSSATMLRGSERASTSLSLDSSGQWSNDTDVFSRKSSYFRAPNIAATSSAKREPMLPPTDRSWREKRDTDRIKKEKEMLKLPVIHSAGGSKRTPNWDSGKNISSKRDSIPLMEPLPGISAAKALLEDSMKIPSIYDPQRSDKTLEYKPKSSPKKVTFADEKREPLMSVSEIEPNGAGGFSSSLSKNSARDKSLVPSIIVSKNHFQPMLRPRRPRKTTLPPLNLSLAEVRRNPRKVTDGVNEWKSLYREIIDPEERMKALADIMYAVRVKKFENEQALRSGETPTCESERSMPREIQFLRNSTERIQYRDENGQVLFFLFSQYTSDSLTDRSVYQPCIKNSSSTGLRFLAILY